MDKGQTAHDLTMLFLQHSMNVLDEDFTANEYKAMLIKLYKEYYPQFLESI